MAYLCYSLTEKMSDAAPNEPVGDEIALYQGHQSLEAHIIRLPQHALLSHIWVKVFKVPAVPTTQIGGRGARKAMSMSPASAPTLAVPIWHPLSIMKGCASLHEG